MQARDKADSLRKHLGLADFGVEPMAAHKHPTVHNLSPVESNNVRQFPVSPQVADARRMTTEKLKSAITQKFGGRGLEAYDKMAPRAAVIRGPGAN